MTQPGLAETGALASKGSKPTAPTAWSAKSWPVRALAGLVGTIVLVVLAYFFIDRPVAFFVDAHELKQYRWLRLVTKPPEAFVLLAPVVLLAGVLKRWFSPWTRLERVGVAAAVSTFVTALAALVLKMIFGRYCPDLWIGDGPSLLHGGVYGFNPFHVGAAYWAFPSGHTACTVAVAAVGWNAYPRWRLAWGALAGLVTLALVVLNFHFVGDTIAGAFVGWVIAGSVVRWFEVGPEV